MKIKILNFLKELGHCDPKSIVSIFRAKCKDKDIMKYINDFSQSHDVNFATALYMIVNDIDNVPICIDCNVNKVKFQNYEKGFKIRCPKCASKFSGLESQRKRSSNPETMARMSEKLKAAAERKRIIRELEKSNYKYTELTLDNIKRAQDEVQCAYDKGYIKDKMDNLLLNKIRSEFPFCIEIIKTMRHENKIKTVVEGLYFLYHKLNERPHCSLHLDDKCIDFVNFVNFSKGYNEACGNCSRHKPGSSDKLKQTCLQKYGVTNATKNKDIIDKRRKNNEDKYGVSHPMKLKEFQNKRDNSIEEKYGVRNIMYLEEFREKRMDKLIENYGNDPYRCQLFIKAAQEKNRQKYGVDYFAKTDIFKRKIREAYYHNENNIKHIHEAIDILKTFNIELLQVPKLLKEKVSYRCTICGHQGTMSITRFECGNTWICPVCHPYKGSQSKGEYDVSCIIKNALPNEIIEFSNRSILNGKEIDIYCPNRNIGIEYSGSKYHSTYLCDFDKEATELCHKEYHYEKWLGCKNNNIKLITIFDDEWIIAKYRKIAIKTLLSNFDVYKTRINIDCCDIKPVSDIQIIYNFLSHNCLDRFDDFDHSYALIYDNKIISMFCYCKCDNYWNIRYCNDKDYYIENDFRFLLDKFINDHKPEIIRYSINRDWLDIPKNFEECGFIVIDDNMNLNQYYWGLSLWKRKMMIDFNEKNYEALNSNRLNYLYDCGNVIYEKKLC